MKISLITLVLSLILGSNVFAQSPAPADLPILDGTLVHVSGVKLINSANPTPADMAAGFPYHADLVATVSYRAGCEKVSSLVIVREPDNVNFKVYETHERISGGRRCGVVISMTKDIVVKRFYKPQSEEALYKVNGVSVGTGQ